MDKRRFSFEKLIEVTCGKVKPDIGDPAFLIAECVCKINQAVEMIEEEEQMIFLQASLKCIRENTTNDLILKGKDIKHYLH